MSQILNPKYWNWSTWIVFLAFGAWMIQIHTTPSAMETYEGLPHSASGLRNKAMLVSLAVLLVVVALHSFLTGRYFHKWFLRLILIGVSYFGFTGIWFLVSGFSGLDLATKQNALAYFCAKEFKLSACKIELKYEEEARSQLSEEWQQAIEKTVLEGELQHFETFCETEFDENKCRKGLEWLSPVALTQLGEPRVSAARAKAGQSP